MNRLRLIAAAPAGVCLLSSMNLLVVSTALASPPLATAIGYIPFEVL